MTQFSARKAFALQRTLAKKVAWEGNIENLRWVVGLDLAYVRDTGIATAALLKYPELTPVKYSVVIGRVTIPYVPGLLAFREAPLMFVAYKKLGIKADLIIVDGHGVTHPRGLGIASHIGVVLDVPSIGAAKKRLTGQEITENGKTYIVINNRKAALVLHTSPRKTIYLSIGHKVGIDEIERLAPTFFKGHQLPEPTYVADKITKEVRRRLVQGHRG